MPGAGADDLDFDEDDSAPTAKTLSARIVSDEPHDGHFGFVSAVIDRCNWSNFVSQALQVYS